MTDLLEMRAIVKRFPNGVVANHHVDFSVRQGEIHALVGENGAGKSTLMRILYGLEQPTGGSIRLDGRQVTIPNTQVAIALGIGMVHQNFMLVPSFTVAANVVLGNEPRRGRLLDSKAAIATTRRLAVEAGLAVEPEAPVEATPVGMRQRVEILKALYRGADLLILDEPTAVLTPQEADDLFAALRRLVTQGKTVIFITHKLAEVKALADRVTVMQRGRVTGCMESTAVSEADIARLMVGREVLRRTPRPPTARGPCVVELRNLGYVAETGQPRLRNIDLDLYAGEILGIAGVEGNGQSELAEVISGLRPATTGEIRVNGIPVTQADARALRRAGVAHIPEDRLANGIAPHLSIAENLVADRYDRSPFVRRGVLAPGAIHRQAEQLMAAFDIRGAGPATPMQALSGGNMQKVIVAREVSASPVLLIAAQPTRGVDIGATEFVHGQLLALRGQGCAVLLISADLEELLTLSDRIAVMRGGRIVASLDNSPALDQQALGMYMLGAKKEK